MHGTGNWTGFWHTHLAERPCAQERKNVRNPIRPIKLAVTVGAILVAVAIWSFGRRTIPNPKGERDSTAAVEVAGGEIGGGAAAGSDVVIDKGQLLDAGLALAIQFTGEI